MLTIHRLVAVALALAVFCAADPLTFQPFTKGNVLLIKRLQTPNFGNCVQSSLVEITTDGDIVQEIALPTNSSEPNACLVWNSDYHSRLSVATDGVRAIIPCCTHVRDPETDTVREAISFGIIHGNGHFETTPPLLGDTEFNFPILSTLDGEDIWYSIRQKVLHTDFSRNNSTVIFEGDVFSLQIDNGKLYASNFEKLGIAVAQVGEGLPKEPTTDLTALLAGLAMVNHFDITDNVLSVSFFPGGFGLYSADNATEIDFVAPGIEIGHFAYVPGPEKAICASHGGIPLIYSMDLTPNNFGKVTLMLNATDVEFYYSPCMVPESSCENLKKDFEETDVDCGGLYCAKCAGNKQCVSDDDCVSGICTSGVCEAVVVPTAPTSVTPIASEGPVAVQVPSASPSSEPSKAPTDTSLSSSAASLIHFTIGSNLLLAWIAM